MIHWGKVNKNKKLNASSATLGIDIRGNQFNFPFLNETERNLTANGDSFNGFEVSLHLFKSLGLRFLTPQRNRNVTTTESQTFSFSFLLHNYQYSINLLKIPISVDLIT